MGSGRARRLAVPLRTRKDAGFSPWGYRNHQSTSDISLRAAPESSPPGSESQKLPAAHNPAAPPENDSPASSSGRNLSRGTLVCAAASPSISSSVCSVLFIAISSLLTPVIPHRAERPVRNLLLDRY